MVQCDNGDWHRIDSHPQPTLQRRMALLDLCRCICVECHYFYCFSRLIYPALRHLPRDLVRDDPPPSAIALSWYFPHGSGNDYQHDCLRLRPRMGSLGYSPSTCKDSIVAITQHAPLKADFGQAWALWWLDVVISLFTCLYLPFVMYNQPTHCSLNFHLTIHFQHVLPRDRPSHHDRCLAPPHSRPHSRRRFRPHRRRCSFQPAPRPLDRNHKLYPLGHRCAPRHGSLSHLLPATHNI